MSGAPLAKRLRADEPADDAAPEVTYAKGTPWLEDGNVVLVAGKTAFRVLRSVLSKHSSVFEDMFMIPQPPDAETFEGCPAIQLQDADHDVEVVLRALFDTYVFLIWNVCGEDIMTWASSDALIDRILDIR